MGWEVRWEVGGQGVFERGRSALCYLFSSL